MDLTRDDLLHALRALDSELGVRGIETTLHVVGGAALTLAHGSPRSTADVDAVFENYSQVRDAIEAVARRLELRPDWVNSQIWDIGLPFEKDEPEVMVIGPCLELRIASGEFLLYTKITAGRHADKDYFDAVYLARHLGLRDEQGIIAAVEQFGKIDGAQELFVEEIVREVAGE